MRDIMPQKSFHVGQILLKIVNCGECEMHWLLLLAIYGVRYNETAKLIQVVSKWVNKTKFYHEIWSSLKRIQ